MKLKEGDTIKIWGWPLLKNMVHAEVYQVVSVFEYYGSMAYGFKRLHRPGHIKKLAHYADKVDVWIHNGPENLNRIEILQPSL
jgi:hypothetical protein